MNNNKTSLLDAILELQRTIVAFRMPATTEGETELLALNLQELQADYERQQQKLRERENIVTQLRTQLAERVVEMQKLHEFYETTLEPEHDYDDLRRDFEVQSHILDETYKKLDALEHQFRLKVHQCDETVAQLERNLAEAEQEIDELEAESEAATIALAAEVANLETELANTKAKLDEVLFAAESETLQLREELHSATGRADTFQEKFALLQQTNLQLLQGCAQENAKLRQAIDEINLDGGWRATAEQERRLRQVAEARLNKLEQAFRAILE